MSVYVQYCTTFLLSFGVVVALFLMLLFRVFVVFGVFLSLLFALSGRSLRFWAATLSLIYVLSFFSSTLTASLHFRFQVFANSGWD